MQHIESGEVSPHKPHIIRYTDSVRDRPPFEIRVLDNTPIAECGEALHWPQYYIDHTDMAGLRLKTYRICKRCMAVVFKREHKGKNCNKELI